MLEQEEIERHKLGRKIAMEEDWLRYGVTARRKRNQKRLATCTPLRKKHKEQRGAVGKVKLEAAEADLSGRLVVVAEAISKAYGDRTVVRRLFHAHHPRRPRRHRRAERCRQDHAAQHADRQLSPDTGEVKLGTNLAEVDLDQRRRRSIPRRRCRRP